MAFAQCVCENGHYYTYSDDMGDCGCSDCSLYLHVHGYAKWENRVNGWEPGDTDNLGEIPKDVFNRNFLLTPAEKKACDLGFIHILSPAIYKIPTEEEVAPLRRTREQIADAMLRGKQK